MLEKRGHVSKRLVHLELLGEGAIARGDAITDESGKAIGEVTSAFAARALGYVKWKFATQGAEVRLPDGKRARVSGPGARPLDAEP